MKNFISKISVNKKEIVIGMISIILGIILPFFINSNTFEIHPLLEASIINNDKSLLIIASGKLILLNSVRGLPNYLGVFLIANAFQFKKVNKNSRMLNVLKFIFVCIGIPFVYFLVEKVASIKYDLGIPAFILITVLFITLNIKNTYIDIFKKILIISFSLVTVQILDLYPFSIHLPIGRGDLAVEIKFIADFLQANELLKQVCLVSAFLFFLLTFFINKSVIDEIKLRKANEINKKNEKALNDNKLRMLEERTYKEIQYLVHDLKTPLTTIQALIGVLQLRKKLDKTSIENLKKVEQNIDHFSRIISEILYEKVKNYVETDDLFNYVFSLISSTKYASMILYHNKIPTQKMLVNKARFCRCIINLLENSYYAMKNDCGEIKISVDKEDQFIKISVLDNGKGIEEDLLSTIWNQGFTTKNSSGIGLAFVKSVVENHEGSISLKSVVGIMTEFIIKIPIDPNEKDKM